MGTGMICNCKQVSYADVDKALQQMERFDDVLSAFEEVQKVTHCSTGCGGCHDKILEAISETMMRQKVGSHCILGSAIFVIKGIKVTLKRLHDVEWPLSICIKKDYTFLYQMSNF